MYIDIRVCSNARAQRTSSFLSASFENWHDTPRTSLQRATRPNIDRRKNTAKKGGAISSQNRHCSLIVSPFLPNLRVFLFLLLYVIRFYGVNDTRHNLIPPDVIPDRSENWYYASDNACSRFLGTRATISIKKVYNRRKYFVVVPCRKTEHGEKAEVWIFRIPDKDIPRVLPNLVIFHWRHFVLSYFHSRDENSCSLIRQRHVSIELFFTDSRTLFEFFWSRSFHGTVTRVISGLFFFFHNSCVHTRHTVK